MNPSDVISDGTLLVALPLALFAGLVSFASPCVLPLVPGYFGYLGSLTGSRRLVWGVSLFVAGFSAVFVLVMVAAASVGVFLVQYQDLLTRVLGVVVIVLGLAFAGVFRGLQRTVKLSPQPKSTLFSAPLLGATFAIGWTPCLGPTLIAISSLALQGGSPGRAVLLGLAYSLGLGLPFIVLAFGFSWAARSTAFLRRHIRAINLAGAAVLVIVGVLMVTGVWTQLMYSLQAVMSSYVTSL